MTQKGRKSGDKWEGREYVLRGGAGNGPLTVTVVNGLGATLIMLPAGAVSTSDGRSLEAAVSDSVAGPVGVSVANAEVDEAAGAVLSFAVTLSRTAEVAMTVDYATSDGTAQAGSDYTAASGTLSFATGESSKTIEVSVLEDSHDDGGETLTLTLSNASVGVLTDSVATGTIQNHDPLPLALMARFGRAAAVHVVEQVKQRIEAPRAPGFEGRFAGRNLQRGAEREFALSLINQFGGIGGRAGAGMHQPTGGWPASRAGPLGAAAMGAKGAPHTAPASLGAMAGPHGRLNGGLLENGFGGDDVLRGSAFALSRETRHGGLLSFWSRDARSHFSGQDGALSLGGDVRTTMFGADYAGGTNGFALAFKADPLWVGTSIGGADGPEGRLNATTGLAVDVRVRTLLVHQAEGFQERGIAVSFSDNPTPSMPLGFNARVAPAWGGEATRGNRLDGEVGYGLPVGRRFVGTPWVGFGTSEYGGTTGSATASAYSTEGT